MKTLFLKKSADFLPARFLQLNAGAETGKETVVSREALVKEAKQDLLDHKLSVLSEMTEVDLENVLKGIFATIDEHREMGGTDEHLLECIKNLSIMNETINEKEKNTLIKELAEMCGVAVVEKKEKVNETVAKDPVSQLYATFRDLSGRNDDFQQAVLTTQADPSYADKKDEIGALLGQADTKDLVAQIQAFSQLKIESFKDNPDAVMVYVNRFKGLDGIITKLETALSTLKNETLPTLPGAASGIIDASVEDLLIYMPNIREHVGKNSVKKGFALELQKAVRDFLKNKKAEERKGDKGVKIENFADYRFLDAVSEKFSVLNGLIDGTKQNYKSLELDDAINEFFDDNTDDIALLNQNDDFRTLDWKANQKDAEYIYARILEAKEAGASEAMRESYRDYITKNSDMAFVEWMALPDQVEKFGGFLSQATMTINKVLNAIMDGPLGALFAKWFDFDQSTTGLNDTEESIKNVAENGLDALDGDTPGEIAQTQFEKLGKNERAAAWGGEQFGKADFSAEDQTKMWAELNEAQKATAWGNETYEDLVVNLRTNEYKDVVDFVDMENGLNTVVYPDAAQDFVDLAGVEDSPHKSILAFGKTKANPIDHDTWLNLAGALDVAGFELEGRGAFTLDITKDGTDEAESIELKEWSKTTINEFVKKVKEVTEKDGKPISKSQQKIDDVSDYIADKIGIAKDTADTAVSYGVAGVGVATMGGLALANSWNPVGWTIGVGLGIYGGYRLAKKYNAFGWWDEDEPEADDSETET